MKKTEGNILIFFEFFKIKFSINNDKRHDKLSIKIIDIVAK